MKAFRRMLLVLVPLASTALAAPALASCSIHNETNYSFTVESGNTSNQSVGAHTSTTIAPGKVIAKSKEGKSFGGMCKDGDRVKVVEKDGVVMMVPET
jgi:hypothetical protein